VVEVKSGEHYSESDKFQLLTYLRCSKKEVGLLLHFGPKATAKRVISTLAGVAVSDADGLTTSGMRNEEWAMRGE
jgi:hypothetical protein